MAINFGSSTVAGEQTTAVDNTTAVDSTAVVDNVIDLKKVDQEHENQATQLATIKDAAMVEISQSNLVDSLTSSIDINNTTTIVEFGKEPAMKMASIADQVLSKYDSASVTETSKLVDKLLDLMKKIDIDEIKSLDELANERKKKSLFSKFKESAQDKLNRLVGKYKTIGGEMDQICQQLAVYEQQIKSSNNDIQKMYEASIESYKQMVATIMAADQACKEIEDYKNQLEVEAQTDANKQFELQNVSQALTLMQQRTADLRGSESVALMSIPTFKIQEYTNANLARKVNSAFIVTVPAFKTALVNTVIAKQQALQAQGLSALDEATSQLIRKNAENSVTQLQMSQKLANSSAIKAEDIEYSWNTILNGIKQYKEMEGQYAKVREDEKQRIEAANNRYLEATRKGEAF